MSSVSTSYSSSVPTIKETPENGIIDQIAGVASQMAGQMYQWAQQAYSQTSAVTDQTVGNFLTVSNNMLNFSNSLTDQYNNEFAPENAQLIADANSYASPERMAVDMGMAGATQAQASKNSMDAATRALQAYGIDPSSGRYAALDKAAAVQNAANVAGAENQQRVSDIATGQNLRTQAVQVGAQLPAAIANTANTAIQANTGAENASLANANTGANLFKLPQSYLQTAMGIKLPPVGNTTTGGSNSNSQQPQRPSSSGGGGNGAGPGSGAGSNGGAAWMPAHTGYQPDTGVSHGLPNAAIMQNPYNNSGGTGNYDVSGISPDWDQIQQENPGWFGDTGGYDTGTGTIGQSQYDPTQYGGSDPFSDSGFGQTYDFGGSTSGFGGQDGTSSSDVGSYYDPSANQPTFDTSGWGDYSTPDSWDTSSGGGGSVFDSGTSDISYGMGDGGDYSSYTSGGGDSGGDYNSGYSSDTGDDYARGGPVQAGAIPDPSTGGRVPRSASPSGGRKTDDVPANLNAGEFVVPRDVVAYKGHQFFQKLIADSRKARGAPAGPPARGKPHRGPNPAMTQRPRFVSRPMGQRPPQQFQR